jgi:hypothetical protein
LPDDIRTDAHFLDNGNAHFTIQPIFRLFGRTIFMKTPQACRLKETKISQISDYVTMETVFEGRPVCKSLKPSAVTIALIFKQALFSVLAVSRPETVVSASGRR